MVDQRTGSGGFGRRMKRMFVGDLQRMKKGLVEKLFKYLEIICNILKFLCRILAVGKVMSTHFNAIRPSARYAWTGCSTISPKKKASHRITLMRCSQRGDSASWSNMRKNAQNTILKYFVKNCCNGLFYAFASLQYLTNLSRFVKSLTSTTRPTHGAPFKKRLQKLQTTTTPYRLLEHTVQVISGVLATARSVPHGIAANGSRTTSH